jgi:recombination protein RecT
MATQDVVTVPPVPKEVLAIKRVLDAAQSRIAEACTGRIKPEQLLRVAMATIYRTPELQKCDPWSIANALIEAAASGLEIGGPGSLAEAWLLPYRNGKSGTMEAQFVPSYRGLAKIVVDSGAAAFIDAHVVYENDRFEFGYGIRPWVKHEPTLKDRGKPIAVYAAGERPDGSPFLDVLTVEDVEKARAAGKAHDSLMWTKFWGEGARKTAIRRMVKRLKGHPVGSHRLFSEIEQDNAAVDLPKELDFRERPMPRRLPPATSTDAPPAAAAGGDDDAWLDAHTEFLDACREAGRSQKYVDDALALAKSQPDPAAALRANVAVLRSEQERKAEEK